MGDQTKGLAWVGKNSRRAMEILQNARAEGRPVVLLAGAGISVDSGFPLASQMKEYLIQVREYVHRCKYYNVRQYIEEARWPSRHDLRVDFQILERAKAEGGTSWREAERRATQAALVAELRGTAPTLASSLEEVFGQLDDTRRRKELERLYHPLKQVAQRLGQRSPQNVAYRSLLFSLCENNQATIDSCFDHFIRDRSPTTTHQFIYFLTRLLRIPVIFTTNFDPLLEMAFAGEGLVPRVYEMQGEGSIPSARLLLSQPLSIVKLHGGAHQMQTGFSLDNQLSSSAIASFSELYTRLGRESGKAPLTVVVGYSGSDRRVMDIIAAQVREWKPAEGPTESVAAPNILWVGRSDVPPDLLTTAVDTNPAVMQRSLQSAGLDEAKTRKSGIVGTGKPSRSLGHPAHLVPYHDGRLFFLEALQVLNGHFPIARSFYQAVNFVPHSFAGAQSASKLVDDRAEVKVLRELPGGGSSRSLVRLMTKLETEGFRTIWVDLTEVTSVSSLIDVISERLMKLDSRLQPVRRPLMLQCTTGTEPSSRHSFLRLSFEHEIRCAVQWLRHALRRGKYLLALDSLNEFPSEHPALKTKGHDAQRRDLCRVIKMLAAAPGLIGDSRVAIALSVTRKQEKDFKQLGKLIGAPSRPTPKEATKTRKIGKAKIPLADECVRRFPKFGTKGGTWTDISSNFTLTVLLLISCCARRVRSEVLLKRCTAEYIARIWPRERRCPGPANSRLSKDWIARSATGQISLFSAQHEFSPADDFWESSSSNQQLLNSEANAQDEEKVVECLYDLCGHRTASSRESDGVGRKKDLMLSEDRQWLYRTEGGYHWMHRDVRNGLYEAILSRDDPHSQYVLALAHHVIAIFCYDELYERSRDARAFLEYLFHRVSAVRRALDAKEFKCVLAWLKRMLWALHREKHALLTRVRVPAFIAQLAQVREVIDEFIDALEKAGSQGEELREAQQLKADLLQYVSEFFLASGHPHSALGYTLHRLPLVLKPGSPFPMPRGVDPSAIVGTEEFDLVKKWCDTPGSFSKDNIKGLSAFRDVAYACHDPLLSLMRFPAFPSSKKELKKPQLMEKRDWVDVMAGKSATKVMRKKRLDLAECIYDRIFKLYGPREPLRLWNEYDETMDFFGGMVRKRMEFRLLTRYPDAWIDGSALYLKNKDSKKAVLARHRLEVWQKKARSLPYIEADDAGTLPLLRRTGKCERHECYRLCLQARATAARYFAPRKESDATLERWTKVRSLLEEAESILNRAGGPADRQAMAITRLTWAELLVRRAEALQAIHEDQPQKDPAHTDEADDPATRSDSSAARYSNDASDYSFMANEAVDEAMNVLTTVEQLMNEGRGENRWRFFYLLTLSRGHLLRAFSRRSLARRSAKDDMNRAARHLIGALNNCGIWTDRYDVLVWWWNSWQEAAKTIWNGDANMDMYFKHTLARLGISWFGRDRNEKPRGRRRRRASANANKRSRG